MGQAMTPARRYGPAGVHREPARPEPIAYAVLCAPADTYRAVLALLDSPGTAWAAHAILLDASKSGCPHAHQAAGALISGTQHEQRIGPQQIANARRIIAAALEREEDAST